MYDLKDDKETGHLKFKLKTRLARAKNRCKPRKGKKRDKTPQEKYKQKIVCKNSIKRKKGDIFNRTHYPYFFFEKFHTLPLNFYLCESMKPRKRHVLFIACRVSKALMCQTII